MRDAVVFFSDANLFPAAVFAAARASALNKRGNVDIIIFTKAGESLAPVRTRAFQVVPLEAPRGITLSPQYYRLLIPGRLAGRYRRLLYLDTDTYLDDARSFALFDLAMGGHALAAVRDLFVAFLPDAAELERTLATAGTKYLNSGVLLIDCAAFDRLNVLKSLPALLPRIAAAPGYFDQTLLNMLLDGDWLELSPALNMLSPVLGSVVSRACPPAITHFAGRAKPWRAPPLSHVAAREMRDFFQRSPWPTFYLPGVDRKQGAGPDWGGEFGRRVMAFLRSASFADVAAGITKLRLDELA